MSIGPKLMGYGVILGSSLSKVPQIVNIVKAASVSGLSLPMYLMETGCQIVTICYHVHRNNGFDVYGENLTLGIGNVVILCLWARLHNKLFLLFGSAIATAIIVKWIMNNKQLLTWLYGITIMVYVSSRLPQIYTNFATGSTGVLSPITFAFNGIGSVIRIFTSLTINDRMMTIGMLSSIICNSTLVAQILYYRKRFTRN